MKRKIRWSIKSSYYMHILLILTVRTQAQRQRERESENSIDIINASTKARTYSGIGS